MDDSFEALMKKKMPEKPALEEADTDKVVVNVSHLSKKEQLKLLKTSLPQVLKWNKEFSSIWEELENVDFESLEDKTPLFLKFLYLANIAFQMSLLAQDSTSYKSHPVEEVLGQMEELVQAYSQVEMVRYSDLEGSEEEQENGSEEEQVVPSDDEGSSRSEQEQVQEPEDDELEIEE